MKFTQTFLSKEEKCERKTNTSLKSTLTLNEELLNFYYDLYEKQLNDSERDLSLQDLSILIIHTKILKSFNCLTGLLKRGHYSECQSIQRDVYELTYLAEYLIKNPDKVDPWFHGEEIKHRHVAKNLDLPNAIREMYGLMCDFTHPNIKGARSNLIVGYTDEQIFFKTLPEFHKPTAHGLLMQQISFIYVSINQFFPYFEKYNNFNSDDEKQISNFYEKWQKKRRYWEKLLSESDYEMFPISRR
jgi:hypothetical protein